MLPLPTSFAPPDFVQGTTLERKLVQLFFFFAPKLQFSVALKHGVVTPNLDSWKPSRMLQECVGTVGVKRDCTNVRAVSGTEGFFPQWSPQPLFSHSNVTSTHISLTLLFLLSWLCHRL